MVNLDFREKKTAFFELFFAAGVLRVHSKITFSIERNVIMIGLLFDEE